MVMGGELVVGFRPFAGGQYLSRWRRWWNRPCYSRQWLSFQRLRWHYPQRLVNLDAPVAAAVQLGYGVEGVEQIVLIMLSITSLPTILGRLTLRCSWSHDSLCTSSRSSSRPSYYVLDIRCILRPPWRKQIFHSFPVFLLHSC